MAQKLVAAFNDNLGITRTPNVDSFTKYAYWISGPNAKHNALKQYDLQRTGYGRLFIVQMPRFVEKLLPDETTIFKHMLEFGNVGIDGIQGFSVETTQATGGYAGASIEMPTGTKDDTSSITVKVYETIESMVRSYVDFWITGTFDPYTGLNHYHGARETSIGISAEDAKTMYFSQANHTMEAFYIATDPTGEVPIYSCLLTNMFPKQSDHSHFNFDPGSHELVQVSIEFTVNKYMGSDINYLGKVILDNFKILKNFMLTYSGYSKSDILKHTKTTNISEWYNSSNGQTVDRRVGGWGKSQADTYMNQSTSS